MAQRFSIAGAIALVALVAGPGHSAAPPPNIVVILIDDLRSDALGCTGHPFAKTPQIDRLAREGALFRNAFVTTPLCLPSRASFLTGLYPHAHGVTGSGDFERLSFDLPTFPRTLQAAGYTTAFVGKWHLGSTDTPRSGFDRWFSFKGQGVYNDPVLNVDGERGARTGYLTDLLNDEAVQFIHRPHETPFLLYLSHKAVHAPFIPAPRHRDLYDDVSILPAPSTGDSLAGKPVLRRAGVKHSPNDPDLIVSDALVRDQLRCLASVDEGVGRIIEALEQTKRLNNTMIVFSSDNGYFWGEHGLGGKHGPYEEAIRVPLVIRYPKLVSAGTTIDALALNVDLAPTLLELAGMTPAAVLHGRSWLPLLRGDSNEWRSSILLEYFLNPGQTATFPTWQAVRSADWKYIHYPDQQGMDELYHLRADPHEMRNVIAQPTARSALKIMQEDLAHALIEADFTSGR